MSRYIVRIVRKRTPDYAGCYLAPSPVAALSAAGHSAYFRRLSKLGKPLSVSAELLPDGEIPDLQPSRR